MILIQICTSKDLYLTFHLYCPPLTSGRDNTHYKFDGNRIWSNRILLSNEFSTHMVPIGINFNPNLETMDLHLPFYLNVRVGQYTL